MNHEDIVKRLMNGEDPGVIAQELADMLNAAEAEIAEMKREDAKSKKMDEISIAIAHALNDYAHVAGIEGFEPLRGVEVRQLLDEFLPIMESLKNVKIHIANAEPQKVEAPKVKKFAKPEDVFAWFFNDLGI